MEVEALTLLTENKNQSCFWTVLLNHVLKHCGKSLGNKSPKYKAPSVTFSCLKRESWTHRSVFLLQVFLLLAVCMGQARVVLLVRVVVLVVVVVESVLVQVQAQPIRHSAGLLLAQRSCLVLSPLVRLQGHVLLPKTKTDMSVKHYFWIKHFDTKKECIMVSTKILSSTTVFTIDNNKQCFLSSKSVISEGSSDTEDWSNDSENSALSSQE